MSTHDYLIGILFTLTGIPKILWCKLRGVKIGIWSGVRLISIPKLSNAQTIVIGKNVTIGRLVRLEGKITLGDRVFVNEFGSLCASPEAPIIVGEGTSFGPGCFLITGDHDTRNGIATNSPEDQGGKKARIILGKNCWLGAKVIVLKGVSIGNGAIIGAGSVVTKDIPPNCVAVGNPARVIKTRR